MPPSLEAFKAKLDRALSNLVYRGISLTVAELDDLKGPFQPKTFHDSMIPYKRYVEVKHSDRNKSFYQGLW